MKVLNHTFIDEKSLIDYIENNNLSKNSCLIQIFSWIINIDKIKNIVDILNNKLNKSTIAWVTTAWEFIDWKLIENSIIISFNIFEKSYINNIYHDFKDKKTFENDLENIIKKDTKLLLVFTDWYSPEVEKYLKYINTSYPNILIAWWRAWDNLEFKTSYIFNNTIISQKWIIIISLSWKDLIVNNGHNFDWIPIWKEFIITKCRDNIIYEIDNIPVKEIYKKYLWELIANELPWIWLEFPLIINRNWLNVWRWPMVEVENGWYLLTWIIYNWEKARLCFWNVFLTIYLISNHSLAKFSTFREDSKDEATEGWMEGEYQWLGCCW